MESMEICNMRGSMEICNKHTLHVYIGRNVSRRLGDTSLIRKTMAACPAPATCYFLKSRLEYLSLKDVGTTCNVSVTSFKSNSIRILHNCRIG